MTVLSDPLAPNGFWNQKKVVGNNHKEKYVVWKYNHNYNKFGSLDLIFLSFIREEIC